MKAFLINSFFLILSITLFISCDDSKTDNTVSEKANSPATVIDSVADNNKARKTDNENKSDFIMSYDSALTLFQTSFQEVDIKTDYGNAHVITAGPSNAPPLVLLHGMNATSTMWYPNIKALAKKYRIYAIDFLLEPGKSTCEVEINDTKNIVDWYFQIFDKLKLRKFNIVGASRGGWLATSIAMRQPDRITKMALLSPAQTFVWIKPGLKIRKNIVYSLSPKRKNLRDVLETMTENVDNIDQLYLNEYFLASQKVGIDESVFKMRPFSKDDFTALKMPVLVLIGDNDIINNDKSLTKAEKYISHVETKKIENAGHFLSMDQAEIVNNELINFLNQK